MDEKILEVKDLRIVYETDEDTVHAVNKINFEVYKRETFGLVGETGAGKTTTALAIMGLLPERTGHIKEGEIFYKGENLIRKNKNEMRMIRGSKISMIFQDPMTSLNPTLSIGEQIKESLEIHNYESKNKHEIDDRVDELLKLVNIQPRRKSEYPHQFSGGMKQRALIAISLACNPELIIADEPTTALDVTIQAQILSLIEELKQKLGTSMVMITHDLGIVAETSDKVAVMYAGEIMEKGTVVDIFERDKHHPYTLGLFSSIPNLDVESKRLVPIKGLVSDPTKLPLGCKFHPRCPQCMEICKTVQPKENIFGTQTISCHLYTKEI